MARHDARRQWSLVFCSVSASCEKTDVRELSVLVGVLTVLYKVRRLLDLQSRIPVQLNLRFSIKWSASNLGSVVVRA